MNISLCSRSANISALHFFVYTIRVYVYIWLPRTWVAFPRTKPVCFPIFLPPNLRLLRFLTFPWLTIPNSSAQWRISLEGVNKQFCSCLPYIIFFTHFSFLCHAKYKSQNKKPWPVDIDMAMGNKRSNFLAWFKKKIFFLLRGMSRKEQKLALVDSFWKVQKWRQLGTYSFVPQMELTHTWALEKEESTNNWMDRLGFVLDNISLVWYTFSIVNPALCKLLLKDFHFSKHFFFFFFCILEN